MQTSPLSPLELQELELASAYSVRGRCTADPEGDLWGAWSPELSFQTPPAGEAPARPGPASPGRPVAHGLAPSPFQPLRTCGSQGTRAGPQAAEPPGWCGR